MALASLTFKEIRARPVICKLTQPAVARIGSMTHLPIILIVPRAIEVVCSRQPTPFGSAEP